MKPSDQLSNKLTDDCAVRSTGPLTCIILLHLQFPCTVDPEDWLWCCFFPFYTFTSCGYYQPDYNGTLFSVNVVVVPTPLLHVTHHHATTNRSLSHVHPALYFSTYMGNRSAKTRRSTDTYIVYCMCQRDTLYVHVPSFSLFDLSSHQMCSCTCTWRSCTWRALTWHSCTVMYMN